MALLLTQSGALVISDTKAEYEFPPMMFMSLGNLKVIAETEQFDWGWKPPQPGVGGGTQLMGFRGYWALKAAMGSEIDWGFNPSAPVVIEIGTDDNDQFSAPTRCFDDVDNFNYPIPVTSTSSDQHDNFVVLPISVDDVDTFGYDQSIATGLLNQHDLECVVYPPSATLQIEEFQFGMNAPFIVPIPFDDSPEQYRSNLSIVDDVDIFGFNQVIIVKISGFDEDEGLPFSQIISDFMVDDVRIDIPVALDVDQHPCPVMPVTYQSELEQIGQNAPFLTAIGFDDSQEQYKATQVILDDAITFGLSTPIVTDENIYPNPVMINVQDDDQFGFNSPQLSMDDNGDQVIVTRVLIDDVEQFSYNPVVIVATKIGSDNVEDQMPISYLVLDGAEEFNWGFNPPQVGSGSGTQLMGFRGHSILRAAMGSEDAWSFNPAVIVTVEVGIDDTLDQLSIANIIWDDDSNWGFNILVMGGGGQDISGFKGFWALRAGMGSDVDNWSFNQPVIPVIEIGVDDSLFQLSNNLMMLDERNEFNWGLDIPLTSQDYEFVFTPPVFQSSEDDYFSFQPPVTKVSEDDSPYNSIPQAVSFYFTDIDLEEFDWGFQQGPAKVSEDDAPYNNIPWQINFTPEIEDEQFSWGFKPSTILTSQDDSPYNNPNQQMNYYFTRIETEQFDWGFNPPVVVVRSPFDSEDQFSVTIPIYGHDVDEARIINWSLVLDEVQVNQIVARADIESEQFGFNQPIVIIEIGTDDTPDQIPIIIYLRDEVDVFGLQAPALGGTGQNLSGFRGNISLRAAMGSEVDNWGFVPPFIKLGSISPEQEFFPNPPYSVAREVENDQAPIEVPLPTTLGDSWENMGLPANPPWPVLDNVDYNDFIKQVNFIIPIYFRISTTPVILLDSIFTSPALAYVQAVKTKAVITFNSITTELIG